MLLVLSRRFWRLGRHWQESSSDVHAFIECLRGPPQSSTIWPGRYERTPMRSSVRNSTRSMVCVSLRSSTTLYVVKWWGVHRYSVNNLHPGRFQRSASFRSPFNLIAVTIRPLHSTTHKMDPLESLALPPANLPRPPAYARPVLIDTYSHLPSRAIDQGDASMVYYRPAPIGADLRYGFERRVERDESVEEHLDGLCDALRVLHEGGRGAERLGGVVTWRGMMTRSVSTPPELDGSFPELDLDM